MCQMIKNKLPKAVSIMGHRYKIRYLVNMPKLDGEEKLGTLNMYEGVIRVFGGTTVDEKWATIWHEICHIKLYLRYRSLTPQVDHEDWCDWDAFCMMTLEFEY